MNDRGSEANSASEDDISDPKANEIATPQLAVDCQVEEREVAQVRRGPLAPIGRAPGGRQVAIFALRRAAALDHEVAAVDDAYPSNWITK